jgi:PepSY-associated TM region
MKARRLHRIIGIILLVPFFCWAITGLVFYIKPGYEGAYEILAPKRYSLDSSKTVATDSSWQEFRYFKTLLGDHLLVRTNSGWAQLDPTTMKPRAMPGENDIRSLVQDAISSNPQRYGEIASVNGATVKTNTGVEITLDWNSMTLAQKGKDTDRIDLLYRIHYLQWTGIKSIDRVVGLVGIALVLILTTIGAWLAFNRG